MIDDYPDKIRSDYIGRFAPSPTGPLHFGSLVAALASYLDAKALQGKWRVRIEDIDPPREQYGATDAILKSLEIHQLCWDGEILYQSKRSESYLHALDILQSRQLSYRCTCSRQDLQVANEQPFLPSDISQNHILPNHVLQNHEHRIYNGHCRNNNHRELNLIVDKHSVISAATRLNLTKSLQLPGLDAVISFDDLLQGRQQQNLLLDVGDFVIHRKDGLFAYQLAVVIDDIFQGITHVIRGTDLLDSTARQIMLFKLFNGAVPEFGHLPLAITRSGQKLSKQNLAPALNDNKAAQNIFAVLQFLNQHPPEFLQQEKIDVILDWAVRHWQRHQIPSRRKIHPPELS